MGISYLTGDATHIDGARPHVVAHICNDSGGWGKGFVLAISRRWPEPEIAYRRWAKNGQDFGLGMVQIVPVNDDLAVANMVAQHGYRTQSNPVAVRYDALDTCLRKLAERLPDGTTIQMPRIGCGLAGGDWNQIEPLIQTHLSDHGFDIHVYDLPSNM